MLASRRMLRCVECHTEMGRHADLDCLGFCDFCSGFGPNSSSEEEKEEDDDEGWDEDRDEVLVSTDVQYGAMLERLGEEEVDPQELLLGEDGAPGPVEHDDAPSAGAGVADSFAAASPLPVQIAINGTARAHRAADEEGLSFASDIASDAQAFENNLERFRGTLEKLQAEGLPPTKRLLCCKRNCCLQLLLESQESIMEVTKEAKRLREVYETRPSGATYAARKTLKKYDRRQGARHEASTSGGRAINRVTTSRRATRSAIRADVTGYFAVTRRKWRVDYLGEQLVALLDVGTCVVAARNLLWASNKLLYHPRTGLMGVHSLRIRRVHGSRVHLPSFAQLPQAKCCGRCCLGGMDGKFLEGQHRQWKQAEGPVQGPVLDALRHVDGPSLVALRSVVRAGARRTSSAG